MQINWKYLLGGGAAALAAWWWWRSRAVGGEGGALVYSIDRPDSFFGGGGGGGGDVGAASPGAVSVAKSGAGIDRGFAGDSSPFADPGGGGGLAALPKTAPLAPVTLAPKGIYTDYYNRAGSAPPPAAPEVFTLPRPAIQMAKTSAPQPPGVSDMAAGRLDAASLGSGGLFANLPTMRRSAAVSTTGASDPRAVSGAKTAAKGGW